MSKLFWVVNHYILRLEVGVGQLVGVHVVEGRHQLQGKVLNFGQLKRPKCILLHKIVQADSQQVKHHT